MDEVTNRALKSKVTDISKAKGSRSSSSDNPLPPKPNAPDMAELFHSQCKRLGRTFVYWKSSYYQYNGRKYEAYEREDLEIAITAFLSNHPAARNYITVSYLTSVEKVFKSIVKISSSIEENTFISGKFKGEQLLGVQNGILCLFKRIKGESDFLLEHTPDFFSFTSLDFPFDPGASSTPLKNLLNTALSEPKQLFLQEWAGLNLTHKVCELIVVLQGEGANGKSVFGVILKTLLGKGNYAAVQPEDLSRDDKLLSLLGMRANICDDMNENTPLKFGTLKGLASGADQTSSRKYKTALTFAPTAKQTWICNHFPNITDRSEGTLRRMAPVIFDKIVDEKDRKTELKEPDWWIENGNMPGILNWAIEGLRNLFNRGWTFDIPQEVLETREQLRKDSQPELDFFESFLDFGTGPEFISGSGQLHEAYLRWMKGAKGAMKQSTFIRALKKRFPTLEYSQNPTTNSRWYGRQRFFSGVRILASQISTSFPSPSFSASDSLIQAEQKKVLEESASKIEQLEKLVSVQNENAGFMAQSFDAVINKLLRDLGHHGININPDQLKTAVKESLTS